MANNKFGLKYKITVVAVVVLILIVYSVWHNKNVRINSQKSNNVKITLETCWGPETVLSNVIAEFEKENKDISIIDMSREHDSFLFVLKTDFAQGNDPDVFSIWPGTDANKFIGSDKVADLTEELDKDPKWKNSFKDNITDDKSIKEGIYSIPLEIIYEGLFINKDLFEKYDVKPPTNYEELKKAIVEFKKQGIIPIAYNSTPEGSYLYQNIMMRIAGKEIVENPYAANKLNSKYLDGMKYMKELYDLGAFPEDVFEINDEERNKLFIDKKAAMIVQGSWFIRDKTGISLNDTTVEVLPFPQMPENVTDDSAIVYGYGGFSLQISKKAYDDPKKKEACIRFVKYLSSKDVAQKLVNSSGSILNKKEGNKQYDESYKIIHQGYDLVDNSTELIGPPDHYVDRTDWENILVKRFPDMLKGEITPEDIIEEMDGLS